MANSKTARGLRTIHWPDLKFPPINLWVMASLVNSEASQSSEEDTRIHRWQRPGPSADKTAKRANALQTVRRNINRKLESLLAIRGGKV